MIARWKEPEPVSPRKTTAIVCALVVAMFCSGLATYFLIGPGFVALAIAFYLPALALAIYAVAVAAEGRKSAPDAASTEAPEVYDPVLREYLPRRGPRRNQRGTK